MENPITIVGGGLAGLSLGIALRRRDVPVTIIEAGRYPRHRVCGEFISGRGQDVLAGWGLERKFIAAGACRASTAAFFSDGVNGKQVELPTPALCLSRYVMDEILAREFESLGGQLRLNERWQDGYGAGVVRATGRRSKPIVDGWRWFGLKVHARNVQMTADLEMHLLTEGYVGLCRLGDGSVNICGLFRTRAPIPNLAQNWSDWLRGSSECQLRQRLSNPTFEAGSFCSVSGLVVESPQEFDHAECRVGDAISMIAPLTGNGMSMAFESAELAVEPLVNYSSRGATWEATLDEVAERCKSRFDKRLAWSIGLQDVFFRQPLAKMLCFASRWPSLWKQVFIRTR